MKNIYIVRKLIRASSVKEALRLDKVTPVLEVYLEPDELKVAKENLIPPSKRVGFEKK